MSQPVPYFRESGKGPSVVCIHCSGSSSSQWRSLMELLADRFRVLAVDLYGSGKTAAWAESRPMRLDDELALLQPVFEAAGARFHLVGHSFGGAIAMKAALSMGDRLSSLLIFEPVLFSLLLADAPESEAAREILAIRDDTVRLAAEGDMSGFAERFLDYWLGIGTWQSTPEARKPALVAAMPAVRHEWDAAFQEPTPLTSFAAINVPALMLTGTKSTAAARAVARLVTGILPGVRVEEIDGVSHMAPVTHPERINPIVERFLVATQLTLAGDAGKPRA
ncbi:MAG: alpha/beta hydrolase [Pirellulales bacterium]